MRYEDLEKARNKFLEAKHRQTEAELKRDQADPREMNYPGLVNDAIASEADATKASDQLGKYEITNNGSTSPTDILAMRIVQQDEQVKAEAEAKHQEFLETYKDEIQKYMISDNPLHVDDLEPLEGTLIASNKLQDETGTGGVTIDQYLTLAPKFEDPAIAAAIDKEPAKFENAGKLKSYTELMTDALNKADGGNRSVAETCDQFKCYPKLREKAQELVGTQCTSAEGKPPKLEEYYKQAADKYKAMRQELHALKELDPQKAAGIRQMLHEIREHSKEPGELEKIRAQSNLPPEKFAQYQDLVHSYQDWYAKNYDANGNPLQQNNATLQQVLAPAGSLTHTAPIGQQFIEMMKQKDSSGRVLSAPEQTLAPVSTDGPQLIKTFRYDEKSLNKDEGPVFTIPAQPSAKRSETPGDDLTSGKVKENLTAQAPKTPPELPRQGSQLALS